MGEKTAADVAYSRQRRSEAAKRAWTPERHAAAKERMKGDPGPKRKDGRSVTEHGYVLIFVGKAHPMADVRGYAYEHRLVASEKLGRPLRPGELAHHDDECKSNNLPGNVIPVSSQAEHRALHRFSGKRLRNPGEANVEIACACGCWALFLEFDGAGRPRKFLSGHNMKVPGGRNG